MVYYRKNQVKKILLITDLYPPDPGGRSEKMSRHVKYFLKKNVNIDVLCPATLYASKSYFLNSNKQSVCWRVSPIFFKYLKSLKWQENFLPQTTLGKFLIKFKIFPCGYLRWIVPAYLFVKRLILERDIGLIITVSNPVPILLLGMLLKSKYRNLKFIAELRDPLTSYYRSKLSNMLCSIMERLLLNYADLIIEWKDFSPILLKDKYKIKESSYLCIENVGFDPDEWLNYKKKYNLSDKFPLRFVYTGGYYGEIKLWELFFSSMCELIKNDIQVCLDYYGDWVEEQQLLLEKFPLLFDKVIIHGRVKKEVCIKAYENADALLYLLEFNKENIFKITSKVYDYIAASKPVIGIVPKGSAIESVFLKYNPEFIISLPLTWYKDFIDFKKDLIEKFMFLYKIKKEKKDLYDLVNYSIISNFSCERSENVFVNACLKLLREDSI